ncbi:MAG TPA: ribonuclease P protein component [Propionibacteriaceae bacterium]|nr:ribonuclease P protein component [Propionibacteriaceae bacterium]
MLAATTRMRSSDDFRACVRGGVRAGRPTVVVHARSTGEATLVGFVVSKSVGMAVTRNRVKRRLRHMSAALLPATPAGTHVVVRALPAAASEPGRVAGDLATAWSRALDLLGSSGRR